MKLDELVIYQTANELSNSIWTIISNWDDFSKETLGKQLVLSTDSIAVNIAIGFGRYSQKESKDYAYNARGALFATKTMLLKANERTLMFEDDYSHLMEQIEYYEIKLNNYIKSIGRNNSQRKPYISNSQSFNKEKSVDGNVFVSPESGE